ncbi:MAG: asparagine synthase (glutamine-hydrolyzing) [bacterium]
MCGIAGIVDEAGVSVGDLKRMTDAIAHRGPDDSDHWTNGTVGLGHRRLSIIDLADGRQPMANEDGSVRVAFNGEIYNFQDLRPPLLKRHTFRTRSDTEVILHLYEEVGKECVRRMRGMFAFGLWDDANRRLLLARDHLGQKPLYYFHDGNRFAFASEIKALLAWDPALREVDDDALDEYLSVRIITPPRSMFRRIRKLPPGHILLFEGGRVRIEPFWELRFEPKRPGRFEDLVEELDKKVRETVRYHLVSDVEVGAFLSGGYDSSIVVGMMSQLTGAPFKTFTGDIRYGEYSEAPWAENVAKKYGTDHRAIEIVPSFVRGLPTVVDKLDEPSDPLSLCQYHLAEFTRRDVKVALGGEGGDELFGGYDRYYGNLYVDYYALIPGVFRKLVMGPLVNGVSGGSWYRSAGHRLKWMHQLAFYEGGERYAKSLGYFYFSEEWRNLVYSEAFRKRVASFDPDGSIKAHFDSENAKELVDRMLYSDSRVRMPDHPVMILDRMTMAHGLEARCPFLDHELAEFCASIPPRFKVRGRELRVIEKALAQRYLPAENLARSKQGFASPLTYILADEFLRLYQTLLAESSLVRDGYLDAKGIDALLEQHLSRRQDHGQRLWLLCTAEIWYRLFFDRASPQALSAELSGEARPSGAPASAGSTLTAAPTA